MPLCFTHKKICFFSFCSHIHRHSYADNDSVFVCPYVREKDVLPLSLCLNEPLHPALTAALRPSGLKLEQLTGADGPARSQAPH